MDLRLDKNQTELSVLVLSVALQVLSDGDRLLDEAVQILGDLRGESFNLEDAEDLGPGDALHLGDSVGVTQDDTDLGRGQTLFGKLADLRDDFLGSDLQPRRRAALVRHRAGGDTLRFACLHTTHVGFLCVLISARTRDRGGYNV